MQIELKEVKITLVDDDIYNLWDILSFYKDYCQDHPERKDAISNGKKQLADELLEVLKVNV